MGKTIHLSGFPSSVTAQEVKEFLERHTGEGTVYAIKIRPNKSGVQRANATRSFLKAWEMECDIVPKPRTTLHSLENTTLHFGCQISNEKFSILWRAVNVSVNFGTGFRKFQFVLLHNYVEYRLELSYENIWQIELHRPRGQTAKYLLIQGIHFLSKGCGVPTHSIDRDLLNPLFHHLSMKLDKSILSNGSTFSCNLDLVPVVGPSPGVDLPYNGCLAGPTLDVTFYRLVDPRNINIACIEYALEKLYHLKECCHEPSRWLNEQYRKYLTSRHLPKSPAISLDSGLVYVRRVQITPSKVYFCGPEINVSNRVLRQFSAYIDNFLRVSFVDEDLDKMFSTDLSPRATSANEDRKTGIYRRILSVLRNGIVFADGFTAAHIRAWMGNFGHIRNVANYAARLGQSFGSSTETLTIHDHEIEIIPDVELKWGGVNYVFSDGIGKISAKFAEKVALKCVVTVDPTSTMKLSLRKSMSKFEADNHKKLDVLAFSKFQPCFLNPQLISLLSTLGVKDNPLNAQEALDLMSPGKNTNILKEMLMCGYKPDAEPFLAMMLQTFRASKLLELRTKTRIFISDGRAMMGCLDETGTLEYGQVFVQFSGTRHRQSFNDSIMFSDHGADQRVLVTRKVVVAKNPCLHPGEVLVLRTVNVPALHHLVDCVVFPQKGLRWIGWIMKCISSVTYVVLVNGKPGETVVPSRELRQGDPLSPYLFLLCAKGLSALLNKAKSRSELKGVAVARGGLRVTYLLFADDCIIFEKASWMEWRKIMDILGTYEAASG
ncbi:hypothetical protein I3760_06G053400 [Carya illinoinensis]|nr:hypothetical protein I3760_06G053400 [Carya illinoinensis]